MQIKLSLRKILQPKTFRADPFYDYLDLMPTLLELAGVSHPNSWALGKSIVPIMRNPAEAGDNITTFSFDDLFFLPAGIPGGHIRAIRDGDRTYAVYFGLDGGRLQHRYGQSA